MDWKEVMGKDFGVKLEDAMSKLAHGIGQAVEHVYVVLVRQQLTDGIVMTLGCLIGLILLSVLMWQGTKWLHRNNEMELMPFIIFPIVGFIVCFIFFFIGIKHILNPEYYAIHEIMDTIGGKK